MNNSSLSKSDYVTIKKSLGGIQRKFNLSSEEFEDLIQDAIVTYFEKKSEIKILNKIGFIIVCFKNKLMGSITRKKNARRLESFVIYDEILRQKFMDNQLDLLLRRDQIEFEQFLIDTGMIDTKVGDRRNIEILCLTTGEVFKSLSTASRRYGISVGMMSKHLSGIKKSAGKFNGLKLQWKQL